MPTKTNRHRAALSNLVRQRRLALHMSRMALHQASGQYLTRAILDGIDRCDEPPTPHVLIALDRALWWTDGTSQAILNGTRTDAPVHVDDLPTDRHAPVGPDRARMIRTGRAVQDRRRARDVRQSEIVQHTGLSAVQVQMFEAGQVIDPDTLDRFDHALAWPAGTVRSIWNGAPIPDVYAGTIWDVRDTKVTTLSVDVHASWPSVQRLRHVATGVAPDIAAVLLAVADGLDSPDEAADDSR